MGRCFFVVEAKHQRHLFVIWGNAVKYPLRGGGYAVAAYGVSDTIDTRRLYEQGVDLCPRLIQGDCLEILKDIPSNSIDLVVTDCPYKIVAGGVTIEQRKDEPRGILRKRVISDGTRCSNKWIKKDPDDVPSAVRSGKMFKHNDISFCEWLPDVFRILKNGSHCYIMINGRNLKELQTEAEKVGFKFVNLLAWRKNNKTPNRYYMQQLEFILLLRKGRARCINNMGTSNCLDIPNIIGKKEHPTEKPVDLMKVFIENSSNDRDIVLDPFMGCGSTGIACVNANRRFIGIELDDKYFNIAKQRIDNAVFSLR